MLQEIGSFLQNIRTSVYMPHLYVTDIIEILIIAFVVYQFSKWSRRTKIWSMFRGVFVIFVFIAIAAIFKMTTILWIVEKFFSIAIIAFIVILQPELRKALEGLGRKSKLSGIFFPTTQAGGRFSDQTINEIVRASFEMAKVRTGALIVIEKNDSLTEFELTGIEVDAIVSSQLLINIFEHNTPLHDGAVLVRGDRVTSATCYLPLSNNLDLDKDLGTRHRAGLGVSEVTDSLTIIVSEETGKISVARGGELERALDPEQLKDRIRQIQDKPQEDKAAKRKIFFRRATGK